MIPTASIFGTRTENTGIAAAFLIAVCLGAISSCGCAHFDTVLDAVQPQLRACERAEDDREARAECISAIVESVEDALEVVKEYREQAR